MPSPDPTDDDPGRRMGLIVGIVLVVSALVAGVVLFSESGGTTRTTPAASTPLRVDGTALVEGRDHARHTLVVFEDFGCSACRDLDTSTRDFLTAYAKTGAVKIEYRPFRRLSGAFSTLALSAWASVLQHGTPQQALAYRHLLYDEQPSPGSAVPDASALTAAAKRVGVTSSSALAGIGRSDTAFVAKADAEAAQARVRRAPTALLDGRLLPDTSVTAQADHLEATLAAG